jgi:hypothetical protein
MAVGFFRVNAAMAAVLPGRLAVSGLAAAALAGSRDLAGLADFLKTRPSSRRVGGN